mmetsp:Transcript_13853/g.16508  ORF Transcript_13853/g.16508 Transcript_13853/m.16508 type:complete len:394 (+) Transcript_13853:60-1241(+)|eukprot:CAMPEP_0114348168 /NCGR_PEP_ID=MMETSP0101-20121206/14499_1 /TAXON_ID=38822 ORGANISM="Pteridomonas danica, Strain PT" /NCGR_SAMPLE_ID=MMETSP0101 /ASSEMBLY_ACC=CAM_ASM_000211 /LENGTH=393 /DNA_ID=CAMNT_0001485945 /DNA_START=246 /DNA_END=1427 /DNA_ORIENTATION=-
MEHIIQAPRKFRASELADLWKQYDVNGNGLVSLGEIDRFVCKQYPIYNIDHYKPALVRAYKFADKDGSGLISKDEFHTLVRSLSFFQDLWTKFQSIDIDNDRSISLDEFITKRSLLGLEGISEFEAKKLFRQIDTDKSGFLRFYELATHCARQLALDQGRSETQNDEGGLLAPRKGKSSKGEIFKTGEEVPVKKDGRKKHMSHDGLLMTAPKGTEFREEWLDIVEGLEDLEHQSAMAMHGLRESSDGGKGGRLLQLQNGRRSINRRRVNTDFQDKFTVPKCLLPLHETHGPDGEELAGFPDLQYHSYKLKMAASPLLETACTSKYWPKAGRRFDGTFRGGWQHPDFHPNTRMIKLGATMARKAPNPKNLQKFSQHHPPRTPFPMPYEPQWDAR